MMTRGLLLATLLLLVGGGAVAEEGAKQKSGRIEGRLLSFPNVEHLPKVRVQAIRLYAGDSPHLWGKAEVAEDGTFVFGDVPAGTVRLDPVLQMGAEEESIMLPTALRVSAKVSAGVTKEIALFGKGAPVVGRIQIPGKPKGTNGRVQLQLLAPPIRAVHRPDGSIQRDPAWDVYAVLTASKLEADLDAEGRFRIERVREGNYRLSVQMPVDGKSVPLRFDRGTEPGDLYVEYGKFTVPLMPGGESDKPFRLGTLSFALPADAR